MSAKTPRIEGWACEARDPYTAPELGMYLTGRVYGHPTRPDGEGIRTSRVVHVSGRFATTKSGSVYQLGSPSDEYLAWLRSTGRRYDSHQPIRMVGSDG